MNDLSAHSFDLAQSRRLATELVRRRERRADSPDASAPAQETRYAQFSAATLLGARAPALAPSPAGPSPTAHMSDEEAQAHYAVRTEGFDNWEDLLSWCSEAIGARAAFAVGQDGFVIAHTGREPADGFDGLGANLSAAVHHMDGCDSAHPVAWFAMEFSTGWVSGFQHSSASGSTFVFALLSDGPPGAAARKALARQVQYSMKHLD